MDNNSAKSKNNQITELLLKIISFSPGLDISMFVLLLLYKRPNIKYEYLKYLLGNKIDIIENMKFLGVSQRYSEEDEESKIVHIDIGSKGWYLIDMFYEFISFLNEINWPTNTRAKTILCIPYAVPAAILTYATLSVIRDLFSINEKVKSIGESLLQNIAKTLERAISEQRIVFNLEEVIGKDNLEEIEEILSREYVYEVLQSISNFSLINYVNEANIIIFDRDFIKGLNLAKKECNPPLRDISIEGLREWLKQFQQVLESYQEQKI